MPLKPKIASATPLAIAAVAAALLFAGHAARISSALAPAIKERRQLLARSIRSA